MFAAAILRLARVIRCAIVRSGTRNAVATSGTVRPPSRRRVSATWASRDSAGWQQVKIRRSRSSVTEVTAALASCGPLCSIWASSCLACRVDSRRRRSTARLRAVTVSHPPGFGGTPSVGHRRTASTNASWAISSARSRSRNRAVREATTLPNSAR